MKKDTSAQLSALMKLGLTREQALDVLNTDAAIDKGANPFPLTPEQEKASKKARGVGRAPSAIPAKPREHKTNTDKLMLISILRDALNSHDCEVEVTNAERELEFQYNGHKYRLTLSMPRK